MSEPTPILFADQINLLFSEVLDDTGNPYLAKSVAERTGISQATIAHIRSGRTPNPGIEIVKRLGRFFGVPLSYFDAETEDACLTIIHHSRPAAEQTETLSKIALRARNLSPQAQDDVLRMLEYVRQAEQSDEH